MSYEDVFYRNRQQLPGPQRAAQQPPGPQDKFFEQLMSGPPGMQQPAEQQWITKYTVQPGDTLSGIAARLGGNWQDWLAYNPDITDPSRISPGQEITVPVSGPDWQPPTEYEEGIPESGLDVAPADRWQSWMSERLRPGQNVMDWVTEGAGRGGMSEQELMDAEAEAQSRYTAALREYEETLSPQRKAIQAVRPLHFPRLPDESNQEFVRRLVEVVGPEFFAPKPKDGPIWQPPTTISGEPLWRPGQPLIVSREIQPAWPASPQPERTWEPAVQYTPSVGVLEPLQGAINLIPAKELVNFLWNNAVSRGVLRPVAGMALDLVSIPYKFSEEVVASALVSSIEAGKWIPEAPEDAPFLVKAATKLFFPASIGAAMGGHLPAPSGRRMTYGEVKSFGEHMLGTAVTNLDGFIAARKALVNGASMESVLTTWGNPYAQMAVDAIIDPLNVFMIPGIGLAPLKEAVFANRLIRVTKPLSEAEYLANVGKIGTVATAAQKSRLATFVDKIPVLGPKLTYAFESTMLSRASKASYDVEYFLDTILGADRDLIMDIPNFVRVMEVAPETLTVKHGPMVVSEFGRRFQDISHDIIKAIPDLPSMKKGIWTGTAEAFNALEKIEQGKWFASLGEAKSTRAGEIYKLAREAIYTRYGLNVDDKLSGLARVVDIQRRILNPIYLGNPGYVFRNLAGNIGPAVFDGVWSGDVFRHGVISPRKWVDWMTTEISHYGVEIHPTGYGAAEQARKPVTGDPRTWMNLIFNSAMDIEKGSDVWITYSAFKQFYHGDRRWFGLLPGKLPGMWTADALQAMEISIPVEFMKTHPELGSKIRNAILNARNEEDIRSIKRLARLSRRVDSYVDDMPPNMVGEVITRLNKIVDDTYLDADNFTGQWDELTNYVLGKVNGARKADGISSPATIGYVNRILRDRTMARILGKSELEVTQFERELAIQRASQHIRRDDITRRAIESGHTDIASRASDAISDAFETYYYGPVDALREETWAFTHSGADQVAKSQKWDTYRAFAKSSNELARAEADRVFTQLENGLSEVSRFLPPSHKNIHTGESFYEIVTDEIPEAGYVIDDGNRIALKKVDGVRPDRHNTDASFEEANAIVSEGATRYHLGTTAKVLYIDIPEQGLTSSQIRALKNLVNVLKGRGYKELTWAKTRTSLEGGGSIDTELSKVLIHTRPLAVPSMPTMSPPIDFPSNQILFEGVDAIDWLRRTKTSILDDWSTYTPARDAIRLSSDESNQLDTLIDKAIAYQKTSRSVSLLAAKGMRDAALHDYLHTLNIDSYIKLLSPWEFWTTRSMARWARRGLERPYVMAGYSKFRDAINTAEADLPERLKGRLRIPVPFLPEWAGDEIFFNPVKWFYPPDQWGDPYVDEDETRILLGRILETFDAQGLSISPAIRAALTVSGIFGARSGLYGISQTPFETLLQYVSYAVREPLNVVFGKEVIPPRGLARQFPEDEGRINREIQNMLSGGEITREAADVALLRHTGKAYTDALDRVGYRYFLQRGLGVLTGLFGSMIYPPGEEARREKAEELKALYAEVDRVDEFMNLGVLPVGEWFTQKAAAKQAVSDWYENNQDYISLNAWPYDLKGDALLEYNKYKDAMIAKAGTPDKPGPLGERLNSMKEIDRGLATNMIDAAGWKDRRSDIYLEYSSKAAQINKDFGLPQTETEWDAWRKRQGINEPFQTPDDILLELYYSMMYARSYEDPIRGFNYELWNSVRDDVRREMGDENFRRAEEASRINYTDTEKAYVHDRELLRPLFDVLYAPEERYSGLDESEEKQATKAIHYALRLGNQHIDAAATGQFYDFSLLPDDALESVYKGWSLGHLSVRRSILSSFPDFANQWSKRPIDVGAIPDIGDTRKGQLALLGITTAEQFLAAPRASIARISGGDSDSNYNAWVASAKSVLESRSRVLDEAKEAKTTIFETYNIKTWGDAKHVDENDWIAERREMLLSAYSFSPLGSNYLANLPIDYVSGNPGVAASSGRTGIYLGNPMSSTALHEVGHSMWVLVFGAMDDPAADLREYEHQDKIWQQFLNNPDPGYEWLVKAFSGPDMAYKFGSVEQHFREEYAEMPVMAMGNLNLIPPTLRELYPWLAPGEFNTWKDVADWYTGLSPRDKQYAGLTIVRDIAWADGTILLEKLSREFSGTPNEVASRKGANILFNVKRSLTAQLRDYNYEGDSTNINRGQSSRDPGYPGYWTTFDKIISSAERLWSDPEHNTVKSSLLPGVALEPVPEFDLEILPGLGPTMKGNLSSLYGVTTLEGLLALPIESVYRAKYSRNMPAETLTSLPGIGDTLFAKATGAGVTTKEQLLAKPDDWIVKTLGFPITTKNVADYRSQWVAYKWEEPADVRELRALMAQWASWTGNTPVQAPVQQPAAQQPVPSPTRAPSPGPTPVPSPGLTPKPTTGGGFWGGF